jgi:tetratricopeptide (TPR) repeat protein
MTTPGPALPHHLAWLLAPLVLFAVGCKPSTEPDRQPAHRPSPVPVDSNPRGTVRISDWIAETRNDPSPAPEIVVERDALEEPASAMDTTARAAEDAQEGAAPDVVVAPPVVAVEGINPSGEIFPVHPDFLPMTLVAELELPMSAAQREAARALNKTGLEKHRRLQLAEAIADYRLAIERAPPFAFSRYNLACALALERQVDEALFQLAVLAHLAKRDTSAADRIAAARVDADFELLRADPRFRALTLATPIMVTWAGSTPKSPLDQQEARAVHKVLRDARWGSQLATTPWQLPIGASKLLLRARADELDSAAAEAIRAALEKSRPGQFIFEPNAALPSGGPPIVLIIATHPLADDAPGGEPETEPTTPDPAVVTPEAHDAPTVSPDPSDPSDVATPIGDRLKAYLGKRLTARVDGALETLELKPTGFFNWEKKATDGSSTRRQGRWALTRAETDRGLLVLAYKETRTGTGDDATVEVVEGLETSHRITIDAEGLLVLDRQTFR